MRGRPLFVAFLTIAVDLIGFAMVVPLLPLYAKHFGASDFAAGGLFAAYSLMQFFFAPLWGRLSDRIGRRPVLLVSIAGNVASLVVMGLAHDYTWLLASRFVGGMFAANIGVANAYVADVTPPSERARGMGLVGAAFGIGFVLGPFLGGELSVFGYAAPAFVAAGLAGVNLVGALFFLPESLPPDRRTAAAASPFVERWRLLREVEGIAPQLWVVFLQLFAFSMAEIAFVLFAKARLGFDVREAGRVFGYTGIVMVLVQGVLIGRATRRHGERRLAVFGLMLVGVGLVALPLSEHGGWLLLLGLMTFMAVGQGLIQPSLSSLLSQAAPAHMQGVTLGLARSVGALARAAGPPTAGALFAHSGHSAPFLWGAAITGVAALVAVAALPQRAAAPHTLV
ncbi:MAG: MFS transporter [Deltaproteobacteria bacterium]|nr:MFS transporter [Deltaproteobacteria bacterium]